MFFKIWQRPSPSPSLFGKRKASVVETEGFQVMEEAARKEEPGTPRWFRTPPNLATGSARLQRVWMEEFQQESDTYTTES